MLVNEEEIAYEKIYAHTNSVLGRNRVHRDDSCAQLLCLPSDNTALYKGTVCPLFVHCICSGFGSRSYLHHFSEEALIQVFYVPRLWSVADDVFMRDCVSAFSLCSGFT